MPRIEVPRALVALVVVGSCAEHAAFVFLANAFPRDLNLAYRSLPIAYAHIARGDLHALAWRCVEPGGWYNVAIAAWLHVVGRSGPAFSAVAIVSVALLLVSVAGLARRWFGGWAAVATVALLAQLPVAVWEPRGAWIHTPEAALLTMAAWALARDPALTRAWTVAAIALPGALAIALRPSGVVWVAILGVAGLAAALPVRGPEGRRWALRAAVVAAVWAVGLLAPLPLLRTYVQQKFGMRDRYAHTVDGLGVQLWQHFDAVAAVLAIMGLAAAAHGLWARRTLPRGEGARLRGILLAAWAVAPLAIYGVTYAGLDNFPLFYVALALVAGLGLGSRPALAVVAVLGWAGTTGARAWQDLTDESARVSDRVVALLDATCPTRWGGSEGARCLVVVEGGLFFPHSEEPGRLELFLLGEDRVWLVPLHELDRIRDRRVDAFATWACGGEDRRFDERDPHRAANRAALLASADLAPAWEREADRCTFSWLTPGGELADAKAAP